MEYVRSLSNVLLLQKPVSSRCLEAQSIEVVSMKKQIRVISLRLILVVIGLAVLNVSPASAQQRDERPMGEIATNVGEKLSEQCKIFVGRPENRKPKMGIDGTKILTCDLYTSAIFRVGYKALLYREVEVGTINQSATPETTRNNAYAKIKKALVQVPFVQDGVDRIRNRGGLTQKAGEIWAEAVMNVIIQTYAFEIYGIRPPQNS